MAYFVGIDVGTQGSRAVAIDEGGAVKAVGTGDHTLLSPRPGWSEQEPAEWWRAVRHAIADLRAKVDLKSVAALGMTGQMHGSVFLDAAGEVIRPALLWNDQRTARQAEWMSEIAGDLLLRVALNPAITGFQAPKIVWLRDEEPQHYRRVRSVLLPKDYIRLLLTGEKATDVSDASGTLVFDVARRRWSAELLAAFDIPMDWMPRALEGPDESGRVSTSVAADLGLPGGIPVAAGGGDNAAAAVGNGIVLPGVVSSSIGTSGVVFAHSESPRPDPQGRLHTMCHSVPGKYHYMGVILAAGGSFRWLRDCLFSARLGTAVAGGADPYDLMTDMAKEVPPGSEGLLFLPYLTGERTPHFDPAARGAFVGLTSRHTAAHLIRAVMEGVTFALRECLALMRDLGLPVGRIVATGGGARSPLWRGMQADVMGAPVWRTSAEEGPAYGAALLASVAAGAHGTVEDAVRAAVNHIDPVDPDPRASALYDQYFEVYRGLYGGVRASVRALTSLVGA